MRSIRALLALAATVALTVTIAAPAGADQPTITFDPEPAVQWVTGPHVNGRATHSGGGGMARVTLRWASVSGHRSESCTLPPEATFTEGGEQIAFSQSYSFPCNGTYRLNVTAVSGSSLTHAESTATAARTFELQVPPQVPQGVATATSGRQVTVSWDANPEVDMYGYLVDRRRGSGSYEELGFTTDTTIVDDDIADAGGTYHYRVWAVRLGPHQDPDNTDDLALSNEPSTSASATVAPVPTSTTGGSGGGDGGGDGGDGGGDGGGGDGGGTGGDDGGGTGGGDDTGGSDGGSGGVTIATTPPAGPGTQPDLSGFARLKEQQERERRLRSTTTDPGFSDELPYDDQGRRLNPDGTLASGSGDRSTFEDVVDRKAALVPVAGGLVLFVGALQARYLTRRARQDT